MFDKEQHQEVLLGNSIPLPEKDYDNEMVKSEYGQPDAENALMSYYFASILDVINKENFSSVYKYTIHIIKTEYSTEDQIGFAKKIIERLEDEYGWFPNNTPEINEAPDLDKVYDLLAFIEFDHEGFIVKTWKFLKPNLNRPFSIASYCSNYPEKILMEIDEQSETHSFSGLITDFLRTYNKENMIEWFRVKSENLRSSILLELLKGE
jgi:hypothetical protein